MSARPYYNIETGADNRPTEPSATTATPMVSVVAPATLEEGYTFDAQVDGKNVIVAVPEGGVIEGQSFTACATEADPHKVPHGKWRDGIFDCFRTGVYHPSLCLAFWCTPLALAQVMTRMKLDWCGEQNGPDAASSTFKRIAILFIAYLAVDQLLEELMKTYAPEVPADDDYFHHVEYPTTYWILYGIMKAMDVTMTLYLLIITIRTRHMIRTKYEIPEGDCGGCEDCCCSYWCSCCTITQMLRHTADYDSYEGNCCTTTGLAGYVPEVVV